MLFETAVVLQSPHAQGGGVIGFSMQKLSWQFLIFEVYLWMGLGQEANQKCLIN